MDKYPKDRLEPVESIDVLEQPEVASSTVRTIPLTKEEKQTEKATKPGFFDQPKEFLKFVPSVDENTKVNPEYKESSADLIDRYDKTVKKMFEPYVSPITDSRQKYEQSSTGYSPDTSFPKGLTNLDVYENIQKGVKTKVDVLNNIENSIDNQLKQVGTKITYNEDGTKSYDFEKADKKKAREIVEKNEITVKNAQNEYEKEFKKLEDFNGLNDFFLSNEDLNDIVLKRKYGTEFDRTEISRIDLLTESLYRKQESNKLEQIQPITEEQSLYKSGLEQLIEELENPTEIKTLGLISTAEQMAKGFFDSTIGLIGQIGAIFDPNIDPTGTTWNAFKRNKSLSANWNKDIQKLYKFSNSITEKEIFDNDFTKFVNESSNQFGQMGAFILTLHLTGGLSSMGKLAVESSKMASVLTTRQFLTQIFRGGGKVFPNLTKEMFKTSTGRQVGLDLIKTFETGLGKTARDAYLKSGLAGIIQTYPSYFLDARETFNKIPTEDRDWSDYVSLYAEPIAKAMLEGMSEAVGAHFLGSVIGKGFERFATQSPFVKGINNIVMQQFLAENIGEVAEERINELIDYGKYLTTNKYTTDKGYEYLNFGEFLKEQAKKSIHEFAMFSASSMVYGKILGQITGKTSDNILYTMQEAQFIEHLKQKYPELSRKAPDFFAKIKSEVGLLQNARKSFDQTYERAFDNVIKKLYVDKEFLQEEAKRVTANLLMYGENKELVLNEIQRRGVNQQLIDEIAKVNPKFKNINLLNLSSKQLKKTFNDVVDVVQGYREKKFHIDNWEEMESLAKISEQFVSNLKESSLLTGDYTTPTGYSLSKHLDHRLGTENYNIGYFDKNGNPKLSQKGNLSTREVYEKLKPVTDEGIDPEVEKFALQKADELGYEIVFIPDETGSPRGMIPTTSEGKHIDKAIYINSSQLSERGHSPTKVIIHEILHKETVTALFKDKQLRDKVLAFREQYKKTIPNDIKMDNETNAMLLEGEQYSKMLSEDKEFADVRRATEFISHMYSDDKFKEVFIKTQQKGIWNSLRDILSSIFPSLIRPSENPYTVLRKIVTSEIKTQPEFLDQYANEINEPVIALYSEDISSDEVDSFTKDFNSHPNLVIMDVETTGKDKDSDIIQLSAIRVSGGQIVETFNEYLKTEQTTKWTKETHNITDEFLAKNGKNRAETLQKFGQFLGQDAAVVGHNIGFDLRMLANNLKKENVGYVNVASIEKVYDTIEMSKETFSDIEQYSLESLAKELNLGEYNSHNALEDVKMTYNLAKKIVSYEQVSVPPEFKTEINEEISPSHIENKDNTSVILAGSSEAKKIQAEELEEMSYEEEKNVEFALVGMNSVGITIFRTKEDLYEYIVEQNHTLEEFKNRIYEQVDKIQDVDSANKAKEWFNEMNELYFKQSAETSDFLDKLYYDASFYTRIKYLVIEQKADKPIGKNFVIKKPRTTFEDSYGKNKSVIQKRPKYFDLQKMLKNEGIEIDFYTLDHFVSRNEDGTLNKSNNILYFKVAARAEEDKVKVFKERLFREGYILMPTDSRENIVVDITRIQVGETTLIFEPYKEDSRSEYIGSLADASSRRVIGTPSQRVEHILTAAIRDLATTSDGITFLTSPLSESYPEIEGQEGDISILDFLSTYKSIVLSDEVTKKDKRIGWVKWENEKGSGVIPSHQLYFSLVNDIVTKYVFQKLTYGRLLKGYKDELELMKRVSSLNGYSSKAVVTEKIKHMLKQNVNDSFGVWLNEQNEEINARYAILKTDTIPNSIKKEAGLSEDGKMFDGTTYMSSFAKKVLHAINRTLVYKQGTVGKFGTFTPEGFLIKNGTHDVLRWEKDNNNEVESKLARFLRINKLAELHFDTAFKIGKNVAVEEYVTWDELIEGKIINPKTKTAVRSLNVSSWIQDGKTLKKSAGGFLASLVRAFIGDNPKIKAAIIKEHSSNIKQFLQEIEDLFTNEELLAEKVYEFAKSHAFDSDLKEFILRYIKGFPSLSNIPEIKDYFVAGSFTSSLRDVIRFVQKKGRYPALYPDGGLVTGFKDFMIDTKQITEEEAKEYFTENGFIKEGYIIVTKDIWDELKYKKEDKALVEMVPPAGSHDSKAVKVIGYIDGADAIVLNSKQAQEISGKDFDFDHLLLIKAHNENLETVWDAIVEADYESSYLKQKADLENLSTDADVKKWEEKTHRKLTKETTSLLSLFGLSPMFSQNLKLSNPVMFGKLSNLMHSNFISTVYDLAVYYQVAKEYPPVIYYDKDTQSIVGVGKYDEVITPEGDKFSVVPVDDLKEKKLSFNKKAFQQSILAALTHDSLDWTSNMNILTYNFSDVNTIKVLFNLNTEEAEAVLKYFELTYKKVVSAIRDSRTSTNSVSQMLREIRSANDIISTQPLNSSFLFQYVKSLSEIKLGKAANNVPNDSFKRTFDQSLKTLLKSRADSLLGLTFFNPEHLNWKNYNLSLMNRITFATNRESDTFNPIENLREMFLFSRACKSNSATQFIIDIIATGNFQVRENEQYYPIAFGTAEKTIDISYNYSNKKKVPIMSYSGTGNIYTFETHHNDLFIRVENIEDGKIIGQDAFYASEYFSSHESTKVAMQMFGLRKSDSKHLLEESWGEQNAVKLFENLVQIPNSEKSRRVGKQIVRNHFIKFIKGSIFKEFTDKEKELTMLELFGIYDEEVFSNKKKKYKESEMVFIEEKEKTETEQQYYTKLSRRKRYGVVVKGVSSKSDEQREVEVSPERLNKTPAQLRRSSSYREIPGYSVGEQDLLANLSPKMLSQILTGKELSESASFMKLTSPSNFTRADKKRYNMYAVSFILLDIASKEYKIINQIKTGVLTAFAEAADSLNPATSIKSIYQVDVVEETSKEKAEKIKEYLKTVQEFLSDEEIEKAAMDILNIEQFYFKNGKTFNYMNYLINMFYESQKSLPYKIMKWGYEHTLGLLTPFNRLFEISGVRNILVPPSTVFKIQVMGQMITLDSEFISNLLDRYHKVGHVQMFSASQINWAINTQIHYAFENKSTDMMQHISELIDMITLKDKKEKTLENQPIRNSGYAQSIAFNIADEFITILKGIGGRVNENGSITIGTKNYLIGNTTDEFVSRTGIRYKKAETSNVFSNEIKYYVFDENTKKWIPSTKDVYLSAYETLDKFLNEDEINRLSNDLLEHISIEDMETNENPENVQEIKQLIIKTAIGMFYIGGFLHDQSLKQHVEDMTYVMNIAEKTNNKRIKTEVYKKYSSAMNMYRSRERTKRQGKGIMPIFFQSLKKQFNSVLERTLNEYIKLEESERVAKGLPPFTNSEIQEIKANQRNIYAKEIKSSLKKRKSILSKSGIPEITIFGIKEEPLEGNLKTIDVLSINANSMFSQYRKQTLEAYQSLNKDIIGNDSLFMQRQTAFSNAIINHSSYTEVPIKWNNLRKKMQVVFYEKVTGEQLLEENKDRIRSARTIILSDTSRKSYNYDSLSYKEKGIIRDELFERIESDSFRFMENSVRDNEAYDVLEFYVRYWIETEMEEGSYVGKLIHYYLFNREGMFSSLLSFDAFKSALLPIAKEVTSAQIMENPQSYVRKAIYEITNNIIILKTDKQLEEYETMTGERQYERKTIGVVSSYNSNSLTIETTDESFENPRTVPKNKITELSRINHITVPDKFFRLLHDYLHINSLRIQTNTREIYNAFFRFIVRARDLSLLSFLNITYSGRNYFGGQSILSSYLGELTVFSKKVDELVQKYRDITKNPTEAPADVRVFFKKLQKETASVMGGFNKIMGKYSDILKEGGTPEFKIEMFKETLNAKKEFVSTNKELQDFINMNPEDFTGFTPSRISNMLMKMKRVYSQYSLHLLGIPYLIKTADSPMFNTMTSEQFNRHSTTAVGATTLRALISPNREGLTYEENDAVEAFVEGMIFSKLQQLMQNTQFQYIPGLFLSNTDSTPAGKAFRQYSHYPNSLEHMYWRRLTNSFRQAGALGVSLKDLINYDKYVNITATIREPISKKKFEEMYRRMDSGTYRPIEISIQEFNEFQTFVRLSYYSAGLILIRHLTRKIGKLYAAVVAGELFLTLFGNMMFPSVSTIYYVPSMKLLVDTIRLIINMMFEDEDEERVKQELKIKATTEFYTDLGWFENQVIKQFGDTKSILTGESFASYKQRWEEIVRRRFGKEYANILDEHLLFREYYSSTLQDIYRGGIPFAGVGDQQLISLATELILFSIDPVGNSISNIAISNAFKGIETTIPGGTKIPSALNPQISSGFSTTETEERLTFLSKSRREGFLLARKNALSQSRKNLKDALEGKGFDITLPVKPPSLGLAPEPVTQETLERRAKEDALMKKANENPEKYEEFLKQLNKYLQKGEKE